MFLFVIGILRKNVRWLTVWGAEVCLCLFLSLEQTKDSSEIYGERKERLSLLFTGE